MFARRAGASVASAPRQYYAATGERGRARRAWVSACSRGGLGPQCCIRAASELCRNSARALHLRDHQQPRRNKEVSCHPSHSLQKTTTQLTNNLKSKRTRLPPTHTQHRQNTHPHKSKHKPTTRGSASRFAHPGMSVAPLRVTCIVAPSPSQPTPTLDPTAIPTP